MKISATLLGGLLSMLVSSATAAPTLTSRDKDPSYHMKVWSEPGNGGEYKKFESKGTHDVGFMVKSYDWNSVGNDGCVVKMCAPDGSGNKYRETGSYSFGNANGKVEKENQFSRVLIGCGEDKLEC